MKNICCASFCRQILGGAIMCKFSNKVKNKLFSIIKEMDKSSWLFVQNPGHDFTRKSTLSFSVMLKMILSMGGQAIHKEMYDFLGFNLSTPTASAFVQCRAKLLPFAFEFLFHELTNSFRLVNSWYGYQLLAVDGSDVHSPSNPDDENSYLQSNKNSAGYNLFHINAMYSILDKRYVSAIVQPCREQNEHRALCNMVDASNINGKVIVIADRGYESYNNMAHIERKGWNYLIRVRNSDGLVKKLSLPDNEEVDIDVNIQLTRQQTNEVKASPDKYRMLMNKSTFDYLPKKIKTTYPMKFRVVRVKISDTDYETLVTNLDRDSFSKDKLRKLYNMRWGIETSFRELKYNVGLTNFHSKKADSILQEIYARMTMYNISMIIACNVCIQQKDRAYVYQINYAEAIYICKHFIRNKESPQNTEALIAKNILPVRPDRKYVRKLKKKSAVSFIYRVA